MYSVCSFRYTLVNSFCALSFWVLILVGFLLLRREAIFTSARFFLTTNVSHRTLEGTSCWGWNPGPNVQKSATKLKLKQNLLKCKTTIQTTTYNVRTLNRMDQLLDLTASVIDHNIDIICIQEHRYLHSKDIKYHATYNGWTFVSISTWKNSVNAAIGGVGMLIGPQTLKSLNSIEKIQPRMIVATSNGNPSATIISCYRPTNISEETDLITFYNELSSLVRSFPKHNVLIIGRDMNVQICKNINNSLHNSSNRNGEHLTDFTVENRLTCLNTKFQKRKRKL